MDVSLPACTPCPFSDCGTPKLQNSAAKIGCSGDQAKCLRDALKNIMDGKIEAGFARMSRPDSETRICM